jgi:acyl carrier protein
MIQTTLKQIIIRNLNLCGQTEELTMSSPLLGAIPELDSMAVVGIITAMEESFGFSIDDDEISADSFETLGSLIAFVERKLNE